MTDYSKKGHYYIQEPRFELKQLAPLLPAKAHVLDMGAGNGNNARFFLERGYTVTAVDPNPEIFELLKALGKQYPGKLTVLGASLDTFRPKQKFDVVVCCMVVHFMKDHASGLKAVRAVQSWTKPSGLNLLTGYMASQPLPPEYSFLFEPGELSDAYKDWKICWNQESYRLILGRIYSWKDIPRLLLNRRGYRAARIIAQKT